MRSDADNGNGRPRTGGAGAGQVGSSRRLGAVNEKLKREAAERERAERSLRESEARARAVLDTAVDAIITIDSRGVMLSFNPAAERLFGYRAAEAVGKNVSMLMPSPHAERHDGYLATYLRSGRARIIGIGREVVGLRKDGSTFPLDLAVSEVNVGGRRTFTGIVRDLTERKRLEQEILEIAEREQRRIGQDLHDGLCQQLTGIAFLTKTLQHRLSTGERPEAAEASEVARLLGDAIEQARGLSRGLHPVEPKPEGLADALRSLAVDVSTLFGIRCRFSDGRTSGHSRRGEAVDTLAATHLYRIAQEAVNNAVRHGSPQRVRIGFHRRGDRLVLTVADDGKGFNLRTELDRGAGAGLMGIRERVELLGGRLGIQARRGRGTIVTVAVPL